MVGGVVSCTAILKEAVPTFPAASLALQFTVVVPSGKVEPDAGEQRTGTFPLTINLATDEGAASPITLIYNWKPQAAKRIRAPARIRWSDRAAEHGDEPLFYFVS